MDELLTTFDLDVEENGILISAKSGLNCDKVCDLIIDKLPPPPIDFSTYKKPSKVFVFDMHQEPIRGFRANISVLEGEIRSNQKLRGLTTSKRFQTKEIGTLQIPENQKVEVLKAGQIGYRVFSQKCLEKGR